MSTWTSSYSLNHSICALFKYLRVRGNCAHSSKFERFWKVIFHLQNKFRFQINLLLLFIIKSKYKDGSFLLHHPVYQNRYEYLHKSYFNASEKYVPLSLIGICKTQEIWFFWWNVSMYLYWQLLMHFYWYVSNFEEVKIYLLQSYIHQPEQLKYVEIGMF